MNFRIGEDLGKLLMRISQEHLLYSLDPEKALSTITDSLVGIDNDLALSILLGDKVLEVDKEDQTVVVSDRNYVLHKDYPKLNIQEWYDNNYDRIGDEGDYLYKTLSLLLDTITNVDGDVSIPISLTSVISLIRDNGDFADIIDDITEDSQIIQLTDLIRLVTTFLDKSYKKYLTLDWLKSKLPDECKNLESDRHEVVSLLASKLSILLSNNLEEILKLLDEDDDLTRYLANTTKIQEDLSGEFEPVNILDNYSAGFLSPDGDYYALNGEMAHMLHLQIADKLKEIGVIPEDVVDKDSWLEYNGWARIHDNWILYGGYTNHLLGKDNIALNDKQKEILVKYGAICHEGLLKFGFAMHRVSTARFEMMDKPHIKELFDY
jgi:hypothetical protein